MTFEEARNLNDRSLITLIKDPGTPRELFELASHVLVERYEKQIHKNWWVLQKQMNNSTLINSLKDEYYSEAWEAFWTAIQKIDISKIRDDKWKCVGYTDFYLRNVRTKFIKETRKNGKLKSTSSMDTEDPDNLTVDSDVERAYWEQSGYRSEPGFAYENVETTQECQEAVRRCLDRWSPLERRIFYLLEEGESKVEIARKLEESSGKIYSAVNRMKRDLKKELHYPY